ncbi:DNA-directed RNA polymerase II subunit RPB9 [Histomonas meleagridis]|uniref:DNA-directed RNA polymerase II subunit RPB9 n=1 Tax=Histomonas meleagridis TaxID=135588 RepID=UPI003559B2CA|nr:DNA-directed RNA polymerase II subunit RPB9 [Histomonas meleagridis]KAH0796605.1 DNA-directed RNA polymerase II subunit RPB9 [Histomonas meleagridis]
MSDFFFPSTQGSMNPPSEHQKSVGTGIKFCKECNNMLVPKADQQNLRLMYVCKNCGHEEPAESNRVYINVLKRSSDQSYIAHRLIADDPTLKRRVAHCPNCQQDNDCVFFFAPTLAGTDTLSEMMECTVCHHQWTNDQ